MEYVIVLVVALIASALTLFSGFGLGTLLMPVVAIFFPVPVAVAMTAMVHFANNIFKIGLLGRGANRSVLLRFGLPGVAAALMGALLLTRLAHVSSLATYALWGRSFEISPVKLTIGVIILTFVFLELSPRFAALTIEPKYLPFGGVLSGFFGGLSGHQGAFRSMFLLKAGLSKEEFVATNIALAVLIDMARMIVYGWDMTAQHRAVHWPLVVTASLSAFFGAFFGARLLQKVTIRVIQHIVSILLVVVALGLISGIV